MFKKVKIGKKVKRLKGLLRLKESILHFSFFYGLGLDRKGRFIYIHKKTE